MATLIVTAVLLGVAEYRKMKYGVDEARRTREDHDEDTDRRWAQPEC